MRAEVDVANRSRMAQLRGEAASFDAVDSGDEELRRDLTRQVLAPARLELKVGAPVILLNNIDDNLVIGSQGVVRAFADEADSECLGWEGGDEALSEGPGRPWDVVARGFRA